MIIVGANLPYTSFGQALPDGAIAILRNGKPHFAIAEERISRSKKAGGFTKALAYCTRHGLLSQDEIDLAVFSSCCDVAGTPAVPTFLASVNHKYCSHHLSHALGAIAWSGWTDAIALVMDSGGDVLAKATPADEWWKSPREQHSAFLVTGENFQLLNRDSDGPKDFGFGEIFRAATYFLGWHGARYAGNTMTLAGLGHPSQASQIPLFDWQGDNPIFRQINDPQKPRETLHLILREHGIELSPRELHQPFARHHFEIAYWVQSELERYLTGKIERLVKATGVKRVVLSGGVAYNCVATSRVSERLGIPIFVLPAAGDVGQSMGNACYGHWIMTGQLPRFAGQSPSLGGSHRLSKGQSKTSGSVLDRNLAKAAASLRAGMVLVLFYGRSEYGPRALGNRSILALAEQPKNKRKLNRIKGRKLLMPVAPAVRAKDFHRFFEGHGEFAYMTSVARLKSEFSTPLAACSHGTAGARVQAVRQDHSPALYQLLNQIETQGSLPVLLNTSLNGPGEPIAETTEEALAFYRSSGADCAWVNGQYFEKEVSEMPINLSWEDSDYSEVIERDTYNKTDMRERLHGVFPDLAVTERSRFLLNAEFIEWVRSGRKATTVRYRRGMVEYPASPQLPLFKTRRFESYDETSTEQVGQVLIRDTCYKRFGDINNFDGDRDGFSGADELKSTLMEIYGSIDDDEVISIYTIQLA